MNIKAFFGYESTEIPVDKIFTLTEEVLDDLYAASTEVEQYNIYFHLQNEYAYLKNANSVIFNPTAFRKDCFIFYSGGN